MWNDRKKHKHLAQVLSRNLQYAETIMHSIEQQFSYNALEKIAIALFIRRLIHISRKCLRKIFLIPWKTIIDSVIIFSQSFLSRRAKYSVYSDIGTTVLIIVIERNTVPRAAIHGNFDTFDWYIVRSTYLDNCTSFFPRRPSFPFPFYRSKKVGDSPRRARWIHEIRRKIR